MSIAPSYGGSPSSGAALPRDKQTDQLRAESRHNRHDSAGHELWQNKAGLVEGQVAVPQLRQREERDEQPARDDVQDAHQRVPEQPRQQPV